MKKPGNEPRNEPRNEPQEKREDRSESRLANDARETIRTHFAKLRKAELAGVQFLPDTATADERVRYDLCQDICRIFNERKMSIQALAQGLGLSVEKTNLVIHSRYDSFSTNELSRSFERLMLYF